MEKTTAEEVRTKDPGSFQATSLTESVSFKCKERPVSEVRWRVVEEALAGTYGLPHLPCPCAVHAFPRPHTHENLINYEKSHGGKQAKDTTRDLISNELTGDKKPWELNEEQADKHWGAAWTRQLKGD